MFELLHIMIYFRYILIIVSILVQACHSSLPWHLSFIIKIMTKIIFLSAWLGFQGSLLYFFPEESLEYFFIHASRLYVFVWSQFA